MMMMMMIDSSAGRGRSGRVYYTHAAAEASNDRERSFSSLVLSLNVVDEEQVLLGSGRLHAPRPLSGRPA